MPRFLTLLLAAVLIAPAVVAAQTTSTVPKCSSGDPVVLMNTKTKTYAMMPKTTSTATGSTMQSPSGDTKAMCLSKAQAMGGKSVPDSSNTQPMVRPGSGSTGGNAGSTSTAAPGGNGGAGPYTSQSPVPAGTANAGTPPPGAPSHSP